MKSTLKEDAKFYEVKFDDLAKELGISVDRITDMSNNIQNTSVSRLVAAYDYMGGDAANIIEEMSNNSFAFDKPYELVGNELENVQQTIRKIKTDGKYETSWCKKIFEFVESIFRTPNIYVCGKPASGKITMAENLIGAKLSSLGRPRDRKYGFVLLLHKDNSPIEYNYPLNEYAYIINSVADTADILTTHCTEDEFFQKFTPISNAGIQNDNQSYIVYGSSQLLKKANIICSNQTEIFPQSNTEDALKADAQLIDTADIIIVFFNKSNEFKQKISQLLQCAYSRWNDQMAKHILFVIPKSDRYKSKIILKEEIDMCLEVIVAELNELNVPDNIIGDIKIVSYSSIYKKNNKEEAGNNERIDATNNEEFKSSLIIDLVSAMDYSARKTNLLKHLRELKKNLNDEKISAENMARLKYELDGVFSTVQKQFEMEFKKSFKEIITEEHIISVIKSNNITRKQEDRQRLVSLINSELSKAATHVLEESYGKLRIKIEELIGKPELDYLFNVQSNEQKSKGEYKKKLFPGGIAGLLIGANVGTIVTAAALLPGLIPIAAIMPIAIGTASSDVLSYYAQTNFEKNTAKKMVSTYNNKNVCEKMIETFSKKYFESIKSKLMVAIDSSSQEPDDQAIELIEKIFCEIK